MNAVCGVKIVNIGEGRFCSLPMHFFFFFFVWKKIIYLIKIYGFGLYWQDVDKTLQVC